MPGVLVFSFDFFLTNAVGFPLTVAIHRKDQKKVSKLEAQIPYHQGRGNMEEVEKIKEQVAGIWQKAREASVA